MEERQIQKKNTKERENNANRLNRHVHTTEAKRKDINKAKERVV